jgi:hypothetical protein
MKRVTILALIIVLVPAPASAQTPHVAPGDTVRGPRLPPGRYVVVSVQPEALEVRTMADQPAQFSWDQTRGLQVYRGAHPAGHGAVRGAVIGLFLGFVAGYGVGYVRSEEGGLFTRADVAQIYGMIAAVPAGLLGALAGAGMPGERWERAEPLPPDRRF